MKASPFLRFFLDSSISTAYICLIFVSLFFRVWHLAYIPGFNGDEAWLGVQALNYLSGQEIAQFTPSGKTISPFYFWPLVGLHKIFSPSFILLRSFAVFSGVLAIVLTYLLSKRAFNRQTAFITTGLIAILPSAIAHSRFAWEPSQSLLACTLVMYFPLIALKEPGQALFWISSALLLLGASFIIYPTNIFLAFFVSLPCLYLCFTYVQHTARSKGLFHLCQVLIPFLLVAALSYHLISGYVQRAPLPPQIQQPWFTIIQQHLSSFESFSASVTAYLRILSGLTLYRYISNQGMNSLIYERLGTAVFCISTLLHALALWKERHFLRTFSFVLFALTLISYFLVAGPESLEPGIERFSLCLLAPSVLFIGLAASYLLDRSHKLTKIGLHFFYLGFAYLILFGFYLFYFSPLLETGGRTHPTFITGSDEPKKLAFEWIQNQSQHQEVLVVSQQYWTYWPLRYLAHGTSIRVENTIENLQESLGKVGKKSVWSVEFTNSNEDHFIRNLFKERGFSVEEHIIPDRSGIPLISVLKGQRK